MSTRSFAIFALVVFVARAAIAQDVQSGAGYCQGWRVMEPVLRTCRAMGLNR